MSYPRKGQEKRSVSKEAGLCIRKKALSYSATTKNRSGRTLTGRDAHTCLPLYYNSHLVCLSGLACACLEAAGPAQPLRRLACLKYSLNPSHSGDVVVFAES